MLGVFGRRSNVVGTLLLDLRDWLFSFSNPLSCFTNCNSRGLLVFFSFEINSRNRKPVFCERIRRVQRIGGQMNQRAELNKTFPFLERTRPQSPQAPRRPPANSESVYFFFSFSVGACAPVNQKN